jgi:hypothetical protein
MTIGGIPPNFHKPWFNPGLTLVLSHFFPFPPVKTHLTKLEESGKDFVPASVDLFSSKEVIGEWTGRHHHEYPITGAIDRSLGSKIAA